MTGAPDETHPFTRGVRDGRIRTVAQLKSEFKAQARAIHPDTASETEAAARTAAFVGLRKDYERALADLGNSAAETGDGAGRKSRRPGPSDWIPALEGLLKRGFPKEPRHEKETARYRQALVRARSALASLGADAEAAFDAFETELLGSAAVSRGETGRSMVLFGELLSAARRKNAAAIAAAEFGLRKASPAPALSGSGTGQTARRDAESEGRIGPAAARFLAILLERGVKGGEGKTARGSM